MVINGHIHYEARDVGSFDTRETYTWHGGDFAFLHASYAMRYHVKPKAGFTFWMGGLKLIVAARDEGSFGIIVTRYSVRGLAQAVIYNLEKLLVQTYRRLIWTAHIWGLAHMESHVYPTWRDVYALAWLEKSIKRIMPRKPRKDGQE